MDAQTDDQDAAAPVWTCPAGTVVGWRDDGVLRATGIRYARAERHQAPVAEPAAREPIVATTWAPACPQPSAPLLEAVLHDPMGDLTYEEHCQRLSVTVPVSTVPADASPDGTSPDDGLPVMVWIHGGSYSAGAGDAPIWDPAALVQEQRVVVVSVTYRLGLFGYLGGEDGPPANLGLLDQLEALRWVQRNISGFGGDPGCVTLFGQSAGADAVAHLMVADGAQGLFHRAVLQSAPLGITRGRAAMSAAMAVEARRVPAGAPPEDLVRAQARVVKAARRFGWNAAMPFGTQYGHDPLPPEDEVEERWRAVAADVDVLIGCTDRETALFFPAVPALERLVGLPLVGRAVRRPVVALTTRRIYGAGARAFARRHAAGGGRGYRYTLTWGAPGNTYAGAHVVDLPLLFGNRDAWEPAPLVAGASWEDIDAHGRELRRLWAGFARTGTLPTGRVPGLIDIEEIARGFHPDLKAARFLPRAAVTPRTLPLARAVGRVVGRASRHGAQVVTLGPGVAVRVFRPSGGVTDGGPGRLPALVWVHGGGYLLGAAAQDDAACRGFADGLGIVVASVEYRLAPEHPFPAPLDDCYAGLRWLAAQPDVDPGRIAVGGASAGAGLAAALALLAKERGEVAPVLQLLSYPMLDDRTTLRPDPQARRRRLWNQRANRFGWSSYLGPDRTPGGADVPGLAAPARYEDLSGAAPVWLGVGSLDLFLEEDLAYVERLRAAGVACDLHLAPGAYHGFDGVEAQAEVSRAFLRARTDALAVALGVGQGATPARQRRA